MVHFCLCLGFWTIVMSFIISRITKSLPKAIDHVKKMHQIPCANCAYFTGDYCLKCTLHPIEAMSEQAIACRDFEVISNYKTNNSSINSNYKLDRKTN